MKLVAKKAAAIAIAAGMSVTGAAGASMVLAAPAVAQSQSTIGTEGGTLHVHKYKNPTAIADSTKGQQATQDQLGQAGEPMPGATFTAQKIDLDLTKPAQFAEAAGLTPQEAANRLTGPVLTETTGPNGQANFNLELGAYLIREVPTEAQLNDGLVPAAPFIAYMPMTNPDGGEWNRDVHVYPKNTELKTEKTVQDADKHPGKTEDNGDQLTYTITSPVPVLPENRELTKFSIVDSYNSNELLNPQITEVKAGETVLTEGTDYTVVDGVAPEAEGSDANATKTVQLTEAAVANLVQGQNVTVKLTGNVAQIAEDGLADGEVVNSARTTGGTKVTGQPDFDTTEFNTPGDQVESYFGKVLVYKHDDNEAKNPLQGAEFQLYKVDGQGENACNAEERKNIQTLTTGDDGKAEVNGLHVTDFENGQPQNAGTYCLVETKAPEGYLLNDTPRPFTLTKEEATSANTQRDIALVAKLLEVENNNQPELNLPGTGGMGVALLIIAGLILAGGGAYAARRNNA